MTHDMDSRELEVLISSFGPEGLQRVASMKLPAVPQVGYLVSCQCPGRSSLPIPTELMRPDVKVIFSPTRGLSVNRNNAILHASAPLCLIADDDLRYLPMAFGEIIRVFRENPEVDIASFEYIDSRGSFEKHYPYQSFPLATPAKGYFITSFELAFRRERVVASGVRFNENFGLGCEVFGSGEEDLWVKDLLDAGLYGCFFPVLIAEHLGEPTTGLRFPSSPAVLRAQGAVIRRLYPSTSVLRILLKAWRSSKGSGTRFIRCLPPLFYGWWQATAHPQKLFGNNYKKPSGRHERKGL